LVLGVGNLLLRDEGLGIHAVRGLEAAFEVSPNVQVLDGGTAGVGLLDAILGCDRLIVCDVARMNAQAGTVARLSGEALAACFAEKQSAHDWGLCEVLLQARLLGHAPETVVVAVEPADMDAWDMALSPTLAKRLPAVVSCLADEIRTAGGDAIPRQPAVSLPR
jgi:hydrogenase maturation protease